MIIFICIIAYLIPLGIIGWYLYSDMKKGETIEEYYNRAHFDSVFIILIFFPVVNIVVSFIALVEIIWIKIKDIKK